MRVNVDSPGGELGQRLVERQPALGEAAFERGQCPDGKGSRERAHLGNGGVGTRLTEPAQEPGRDEGHVDREYDRTLGSRGTQTGHDPGKGCADLGVVVDELERQLERICPFTDREPLVAGLAEQAPGALGQRLAVERRKRLRRAEARACAANEQDARQARRRHVSV